MLEIYEKPKKIVLSKGENVAQKLKKQSKVILSTK